MQQTRCQQARDAATGELQCPLGEKACDLLSELERLRAEVGVLSELVRTDELTRLYNYRHFVHAMELEMERTRRSGRSVSLIMLDLDDFKGFNDRWGHEFGNTALIHVAQLILSTVRRLDIACRYGGEEFAIILPDTSLSAAIMLAERLREKIANSALVTPEGEVRVTASSGVDVFTSGSEEDVTQFLQRTDAWLLQAKEGGRNVVCHPRQTDSSSAR